MPEASNGWTPAEPAEPRFDRRGMGRGLAAILPRSTQQEQGLREIPVDMIQPNARQPRRSFDEVRLAELAESIRVRGLLQPVVVRPLAGGGVRARRRRAAPARLAHGRARDDPRDGPAGRGLGAARPRAGGEHGARRSQPDRGGARGRDARRRPRADQAGGRSPRRPQPCRDLEPDATAGAARGGARADRGRRALRGSRPRAAALQGPRRPPPPRARRPRRGLVGARDRAPRTRSGERARTPSRARASSSTPISPRRWLRPRTRSRRHLAARSRCAPAATAASPSSSSTGPPRPSSWPSGS